MSDSSDDEEPLPKRMCATRARSQLGATDKLLRDLPCERVRNPHYRSAAPMRMYDTQEVQDAVRKAEADKVYREHHKDSIEAERLAGQKDKAKQKADLAAQACSQFCKKSIPSQASIDSTPDSHIPTKLPSDVWSVVLEKLCPSELSAIEGPSVIARNILNAQMTCHDCHAASTSAWHALADLVQADHKAHSQKPHNMRWRLPWEVYVANPLRTFDHILNDSLPWDQIVCNPLNIKNDVLKEACRFENEQVSGTKAMLVLRLLQYFGIQRPCAIPAVVLLAVKHEKVLYASMQPYQQHDITFAVSQAYQHYTGAKIRSSSTTLFQVRRVLAFQFPSWEDFLQYASRHKPEVPSKKPHKQIHGRCQCGNQPAPACQQSCCRRCCQGPCGRHKR